MKDQPFTNMTTEDAWDLMDQGERELGEARGTRAKVWDHPKAEQWRKEMEALLNEA